MKTKTFAVAVTHAVTNKRVWFLCRKVGDTFIDMADDTVLCDIADAGMVIDLPL